MYFIVKIIHLTDLLCISTIILAFRLKLLLVNFLYIYVCVVVNSTKFFNILTHKNLNTMKKFQTFNGQIVTTYKGVTSLNQLAKNYLFKTVREEGHKMNKQGLNAYLIDWLDYYNEINEEQAQNVSEIIDTIADNLIYTNTHFLINRKQIGNEESQNMYNYLVKFLTANLY